MSSASTSMLDAAEQMKAIGNQLFLKGKFQEAVGIYQTASEKLKSSQTPDDPRFRSLLLSLFLNEGFCYLKIENHSEAINIFNHVLELDSSNVKALYRRGVAYQHIGVFDRALRDFQSVLKLEPSNEEARQHAAEVMKLIPAEKTRFSVDAPSFTPQPVLPPLIPVPGKWKATHTRDKQTGKLYDDFGIMPDNVYMLAAELNLPIPPWVQAHDESLIPQYQYRPSHLDYDDYYTREPRKHTSPSYSIYISDLSAETTEIDIWNALRDFRFIKNVKMLPAKKASFVNFLHPMAADRVVQVLGTSSQVQIGPSRNARVQYSKEKVVDPPDYEERLLDLFSLYRQSRNKQTSKHQATQKKKTDTATTARPAIQKAPSVRMEMQNATQTLRIELETGDVKETALKNLTARINTLPGVLRTLLDVPGVMTLCFDSKRTAAFAKLELSWMTNEGKPYKMRHRRKNVPFLNIKFVKDNTEMLTITQPGTATSHVFDPQLSSPQMGFSAAGDVAVHCHESQDQYLIAVGAQAMPRNTGLYAWEFDVHSASQWQRESFVLGVCRKDAVQYVGDYFYKVSRMLEIDRGARIINYELKVRELGLKHRMGSPDEPCVFGFIYDSDRGYLFGYRPNLNSGQIHFLYDDIDTTVYPCATFPNRGDSVTISASRQSFTVDSLPPVPKDYIHSSMGDDYLDDTEYSSLIPHALKGQTTSTAAKKKKKGGASTNKFTGMKLGPYKEVISGYGEDIMEERENIAQRGSGYDDSFSDDYDDDDDKSSDQSSDSENDDGDDSDEWEDEDDEE